jgi:hypothetical protein
LFKSLVMKYKIGIVNISNDCLFDKDIMVCIFSEFIPIQSMPPIYHDSVSFKGYCDSFDTIKEGEVIPNYEIFIKVVNGINVIDRIEKR